jgi:phosphohistidine phosphatase
LLAGHLAAAEVRPTVVLCSSSLRTRETLAAMLIAHNPATQDLALALASSGPALAGLGEKFPTGALATLELDVERWRDLDHRTGTAVALVTPRSLESQAGG